VIKNKIPIQLQSAQTYLFDPLNICITEFQLEIESADYNACRFQCSQKDVIFRKAKVTPKKIGQFVTLWKRSSEGPIEPFKTEDAIDLYLIEVSDKNRIGFFAFSKQILSEKGILTGKYEGKRGFRVYPAWDKPTNKQGLATQKWQLPFFIEGLVNQKNPKMIPQLQN
jgi:hypothetical protein